MHSDVATQFLSTLDFEGRADAQWTFQTFPDNKEAQNGGPSLTRIFHSPFRRIASFLDQLNGLGAGIFACMAVTDGLGRRTENCIAPRAVFLDFDDVEPPSGIGALPPTLVVQSGRGKHVYWALEPDQDFRIWRVVQERLARKFGADPACHDPPRVMRIPGFDHRKAEPRLVTIELAQAGPRYTLDAIVAAYAISFEPPRRPAPAPTGDHELDERQKRCEAYMEHVEPAIAGGGGWFHTSNACGMGGDFGLTTDEFWPILLRWNDRCQPPWEEEELRKKLEAIHARRDKAFGYRLEEPGREGGFSGSRTHSGYTRGDEPPHPAEGAVEPYGLSEAPTASDDGVDHGPTYEPPEEIAPPIGTPEPTQDAQPSGIVGKKRDNYPAKSAKPDMPDDVPPPAPPDGTGDIGDVGDGIVAFRVSRLRKLNTVPPVYYFEIDGAEELKLTIDELLSPKLFKKRFVARLDRLPGIPRGKGAEEIWDELVSAWLSFVVVMDCHPDDGSDEGMIFQLLDEILQTMAVGERVEDLNSGRVLQIDATTYVAKTTFLRKMLSDRWGATVDGPLLQALIARMDGARCGQKRFGKTTVRVTFFNRAADAPDEDPQKKLL